MVSNDTRENRNGASISSTSKPSIVIAAEDLTPETSDDDNLSKKNLSKNKSKNEYEEKIRVGKEYQVYVPETIAQAQLQENYADKALLVWLPPSDISESKMDEYITLAKERYGYNAEQALGMLFWHKHDLEKAVIDLANFTPFPDEWTLEDKILFEQAFQFHGKCFHRIKQMLPDKSIASLVKYYYSWKKTRSRTSVMDRQEKKKTEGSSENGSENGSPDNSDVEDKKWPIRGIIRAESATSLYADNLTSTPSNSVMKTQDVKRFSKGEKDTGYSSSSSSSNGVQKISPLNCQNCTVLCDALKASPVGSFCVSCFLHWRRTGVLRPTQGPQHITNTTRRPRNKTNKLYYYQGYHDGSTKYKKKPPNMYINHDDVLKLAAQDLNTSHLNTSRETPQPRFADDLLFETDREINLLHSHIQRNKQRIEDLKSASENQSDVRLPEEISLNRVNGRWSTMEQQMAVMGFRKLGQNFKAIAEMIGTKTESHLRHFFSKNRKRRNLDSVCQESKIDTMEIESDDDVNEIQIIPSNATK